MIRIPDSFLLSGDDPHLDFIGQHNREEAMDKVDEFDELCRDSRELMGCCWGNSPQEGCAPGRQAYIAEGCGQVHLLGGGVYSGQHNDTE